MPTDFGLDTRNLPQRLFPWKDPHRKAKNVAGTTLKRDGGYRSTTVPSAEKISPKADAA